MISFSLHSLLLLWVFQYWRIWNMKHFSDSFVAWDLTIGNTHNIWKMKTWQGPPPAARPAARQDSGHTHVSCNGQTRDSAVKPPSVWVSRGSRGDGSSLGFQASGLLLQLCALKAQSSKGGPLTLVPLVLLFLKRLITYIKSSSA